jgi:hypothetical protein
MEILLTIAKSSIVVMLIVGFIKFLVVDTLLRTKPYYVQLIKFIKCALIVLTISVLLSTAVWLTIYLIKQ